MSSLAFSVNVATGSCHKHHQDKHQQGKHQQDKHHQDKHQQGKHQQGNQSRRNKHRASKPFCKVCFDSGKTETEYTSHYLRTEPGSNGVVICPTLLATQCRYCKKLGHFKSHCPALKQKKITTPFKSTPVATSFTVFTTPVQPKPSHYICPSAQTKPNKLFMQACLTFIEPPKPKGAWDAPISFVQGQKQEPEQEPDQERAQKKHVTFDNNPRIIPSVDKLFQLQEACDELSTYDQNTSSWSEKTDIEELQNTIAELKAAIKGN